MPQDLMRFRLLQARDADDPVQAEEHAAFAARLAVPVADVLTWDLTTQPFEQSAIVDGVDAVLVGGAGRYSVCDDLPWVRQMIDGLGELCNTNLPMFASCFGFQGLVVALGGDVQPIPGKEEVGTFAIELLPAAIYDAVFAGLPARFDAQLGHKDHAVRFPDSATPLARSELCDHQALTLPGKLVWATQFHPELTYADNLSRLDRYRPEYIKAFGKERYEALVAGFRETPVADGLLSRFRGAIDPLAPTLPSHSTPTPGVRR